MQIRKWGMPLKKVCLVLYSFLLLLDCAAYPNGNISWPPYSGAVNGSLVSSPYCRIPELPIFNPEILNAFHVPKPIKCALFPPLTKVIYHKSTGNRILTMDRKVKRHYITCPTECCYQQILRMHGYYAEAGLSLTECVYFDKAVVLNPEIDSILVKCSKASNGQLVYSNVHILIPERTSVHKRLNEWTQKETSIAISTLIIGIDSVSRVNLYRAMPKAANHLHKSGWFELTGYNKVGDNTLPNLMSILSGYNLNEMDRTPRDVRCNLQKHIDKCPFIWKKFQQAGYVTAYGEDTASWSTFNLAGRGFFNPPTDYYLRPAMLAAEKFLLLKRVGHVAFCAGPQAQANLVYDFSIDFAVKHYNDSYFGLFWTNSFSHHLVSVPRLMDDEMVGYFHKLEDLGILNKSVVFFISDHGVRSGDFRFLDQTYLEERLPFLFVWLPPWLKSKYPKFVEALNVNKHRLTTPHDLHMTLRHILDLSGRAKNLETLSPDCTTCQSIFKPLPFNRSCEDAHIPRFWCTCGDIEYNVTVQKDITKRFINTIENYAMEVFEDNYMTDLCEKFSVEIISKTNRVHFPTQGTNKQYFILKFTAEHSRHYDGMIQHDLNSNQMTIQGISLLVGYINNACAKNELLKKLCWCNKTKQLFY